jgi:predicted nucleotidyltransferase
MALKSKKRLAKLNLEEKFPEIEGISLTDFYRVLNAPGASHMTWVDTADLGRVLGLDAMAADAILRAAAGAGYLEPVRGDLGMWERKIQANALAHSKPSSRVGWTVIEEVLTAVLEECAAINAEPDHLMYIDEVVLFGSALDNDRKSYGDIDLDIMVRKRPDFEGRETVTETILERVSASKLRNSILGPTYAAEGQDRSEILKRIKKINPIVSVHSDEAEMNGFRRRQIFKWDLAASRPVPTQDLAAEIARSAEAEGVGEPLKEIPPVTAMRPIGLHIDADPSGAELVFDRPLRVADYQLAFDIERDAFQPEVIDGVAQPKRIEEGSIEAVAGYHHLCPHWKEDIGGLEMLRRTIEWCREHGSLHSDDPYRVRIGIADRSHFMALDSIEEPCIALCDYSKVKPKGDVVNHHPKLLTLNDLAGGFAIVSAFYQCLTEMKFKPQDRLWLEFDLDRFLSIEAEEMPTVKAIMEEGADAIWRHSCADSPEP